MSTIKSSAENLTLNADGANNDIKFQSNGSEVASIDQAGTITATTFTGAATDATKVPLAGGTMTGVLNIQSADNALAYFKSTDANANIRISDSNSSDINQVGIGATGNNLTLIAGGENRLSIDSTGAVTTPSQPSFRAYKTSSTNSNNSTVTFQGTYHNTGNNFSTSTNKFTAPVAGVYQVSYHFLTSSTTTQSTVTLQLNGNENNGITIRSAADSGGHETTSASHSMYLAANDYVLLNYQGAADVYGDSQKSWTEFSAHLIG